MHFTKFMIAGILLAETVFAGDPWGGTLKTRSNLRASWRRGRSEVETTPGVFVCTYDDVRKTGEKKKRDDTLICDGKEHAVSGERMGRLLPR